MYDFRPNYYLEQKVPDVRCLPPRSVTHCGKSTYLIPTMKTPLDDPLLVRLPECMFIKDTDSTPDERKALVLFSTEGHRCFAPWMDKISAGVMSAVADESGDWLTRALSSTEVSNRTFPVFHDHWHQAGKYIKVQVSSECEYVSGQLDMVLEIKGLTVLPTGFEWCFIVRQTVTPSLSALAPSPSPSLSFPPVFAVRVPEESLEPQEFDVPVTDSDAAVDLVPRSEVYYARYKAAVQRANEAKALALAAFMEARQIRNTYLISDGDDSDGLPGLDDDEYD